MLWLVTDFSREIASFSKISILKTVGEDIARLAAHDDVILLFFAGHGSPETEGSPDRASRYLIAYDTEYDNVYATGLDLESELRRLLERLRAKLVVFIIDACFSGRAGGRTFEGPRLREARSKFRTIVALKKLDVGEGRLILAGADDEEVAREDDRLRHGVFTHFLIETFTEDSLTRELIGVGELYEAVAHKVQTYTSGQQNPVLNGRSRLAALPAFKRQNH